ncbi:MAG: DUF6600 domain-containing protein [Thermoanaerobaculia bacterium]
MRLTRVGFWVALITAGISASAAAQSDGRLSGSRSGYSYVREATGDVSVISRYNGRVAARRNLPITAGDEIEVSEGSRAEISLADGNLLHIGGGTRARFVSLREQQGVDDEFSAIELEEGSVILTAVGADEDALPRIDTEDATVYLSAGARARVNADRRGTSVIARAGRMEVRTPDGRHTLRSGEYMMVPGEEEPEIARGSFSRDRFDLWAADRISALYETPSASARYVDDEYDSEVVALDGYGDWNYNETYSTHVWSPRVSVGWTPYSYGSWYYTPIGLSWWSYDPWGWYPHHYGSWFFDTGWNRWCWAPSYAYSPAWVYWAYTPSYVGWCPTGYYSFYSPWWNNYYRHWGFSRRGGVHFAIHGSFSTRNVDFRGWNFVGSRDFGVSARMDVIPGSRIADRIGDRVAVSSRPFVVEGRGASTRDAIRDYVREAPRVIERTSNPDAGRMAPVLARQRELPAETQQALRGRAVVVEGNRLGGPGVADVAPRGAMIERGRTMREINMREPRGGDAPARSAESTAVEGSPGSRGRVAREVPNRDARSTRPERATAAPSSSEEGWRGRGRSVPGAPANEAGREAREDRSQASPRAVIRRDREEAPRPSPAQAEPAQRDWRGRGRASEAPAVRDAPREAPADRSWRSREVREAPPAVRIIEGAVPGRRSAEPREAPHPRSIERPSESRWEPRPAMRSRQAPPPAEVRRGEPPPRVRESARPQRDAPSRRSVERAPAPPPPQARSQSSSSPRSAPPARDSGRGRKKD